MVATIEFMMDFATYLAVITILLTSSIMLNKASVEMLKKTISLAESKKDMRIIDSFLLTGRKGKGVLIMSGNKTVKIIGGQVFISYSGKEERIAVIAKGWDVEAM